MTHDPSAASAPSAALLPSPARAPALRPSWPSRCPALAAPSSADTAAKVCSQLLEMGSLRQEELLHFLARPVPAWIGCRSRVAYAVHRIRACPLRRMPVDAYTG